VGTEGSIVYAVIRTYTGAPELAEQLAARADEVEEVVSSVQGFRGYYLIHTADGCTTVTVCDDQAGAEDSTRRAADWLREHASEVKAATPQVTGGEVLVQAGATARV
jgi:heme-degrading monooxygenase HmoA